TLESHLRQNYATLTQGEILTVSQLSAHHTGDGNQGVMRHYRFLLTELKPSAGCIVVDTDMEVDVAPLDNTMAERAVAHKRKIHAESGGDALGVVEVALADEGVAGNVKKSVEAGGEVESGEYRYFKINTLSSEFCTYKIELIPDANADADLFVSKQQERPTMQDYDDCNVDVGVSVVNVVIGGEGKDAKAAEVAIPYIFVGVRGYSASRAAFRLSVQAFKEGEKEERRAEEDMSADVPPPDTERCKNCLQWIPKRTMTMHSVFCERNNVLCPLCKKVVKKSEFGNHWHCDKCDKVFFVCIAFSFFAIDSLAHMFDPFHAPNFRLEPKTKNKSTWNCAINS
ncbi:hypothetical protein HK102_013594, partial [Quaeritorhiza haematococci]